MTVEKLTTEKTTLGFFGAMCGTLVSQVPELRLGDTYNALQAMGSLIAIVTMVVTAGAIRRGLNNTSNKWTLVSAAVLLGSFVLLMLPEISSALGLGVPAMPNSLLQSASLKIVMIVFLSVWSVFSYLDRGEPV